MASGGSINTGGQLSAGGRASASASLSPTSVSASGSVGANFKLPAYKHLSSHLHAAHSVLNTKRKTWRIMQHAAALHAGDKGSPLFPGVTSQRVAKLGLDYAVAPKGAYRDLVRGSRSAVAKGLMDEMHDHISGKYKGAGLAKALSNTYHTVHGLGKQGLKHGIAFAKKVPKYWRKTKNTLDRVDSYSEHAGNVLDAVHTGFHEASQQYVDAGLAGSEYLQEELMPGAHGWYDSVKGVQEGVRGVTKGAVDQMQGMEDAVETAVNPVRQAVQNLNDDDLFG